jgi:hypothetical protein
VEEDVRRYIADNVSTEEAEQFGRIRMTYDGLSMSGFQNMIDNHRVFLSVLAERLLKNPTSIVSKSTFVGGTVEISKIFLSHAASDRETADVLRTELLARLPGVEVFLSSRPGHIPTGAEWWVIIQSELRSADAYVILLTPNSILRPWIPFELGAAWMSGRPLFTVATAALDRAKIPMPLAAFQVNSLEDKQEAVAFLASIGARADDIDSLCTGISAVARSIVETIDELDAWSGVAVGNRYFAWDGPTLFSVDDRPPVPTPPGLIEAIKAAGLEPSYGVPHKLEAALGRGRLQVFETDRKSWRREVRGVRGEQVLLVRPEGAD